MATQTPSRRPSSRPVAKARAEIGTRTLRRDAYWVQPALTAFGLLAFVVYSTFRAFQGKYFFSEPYLSPFYSPCLSSKCAPAPHLSILPTFWIITAAIYIVIFPLGFRLTCYYYRKAYYRSFWLSPPACAVAEPHKKYTGETKFPLIFQNIHRYFFYIAVIFCFILTWDALIAFNFNGSFGIGLGTIILLINAALITLYTISCHSCRHITLGRLNHFSKHPMRYKAWTLVSRLNSRHMQLAWASLIWVGLTDLYIALVAAGTITDPHWVA
ncbi:MAG: hypothetical protein ABJC62_01715 [Frankiaceae bacterium]